MSVNVRILIIPITVTVLAAATLTSVNAQVDAKRVDQVRHKMKAVLRVWEFERSEFIVLTRLTGEEKVALQKLLTSKERALKSEDRKGAELLLALDCGISRRPLPIFRELKQYRCGNYPFREFLSRAVLSFESMYTLAFVKPEDRQIAIEFLKKYQAFWKSNANTPWGAVLSTDNAEYLAEIEQFLESGGLGR